MARTIAGQPPDKYKPVRAGFLLHKGGQILCPLTAEDIQPDQMNQLQKLVKRFTRGVRVNASAQNG